MRLKTVRYDNNPIWVTLTGLALLVLMVCQPVKAASLPDFIDLAEENGPVVVNISTTKHVKSAMPPQFQGMPDELLRRFFGIPGIPGNPHQQAPEQQVSSLGSGFVISSDGYILTNNHVVEGAEDIVVRMSNRKELKAKIIGTDPRTDVALIKVEAEGLQSAKIGQSRDLKVGQWVLAIGSPFGLDHTVSHGIVSALGRSLPDDTYVPFIQTDVPINPGNSGGPLINLDGEVVGINSQIYSKSGGSMGLSFSIPIDIAMNVVNQIKTHGKVQRGFLGVQVQEVSSDLAQSFGLDKPMGALVAEAIKGAPAEKAGVQAGDIILSFNDKEITKSADLPHVVGGAPLNKALPLILLRNGEKKRLYVKLQPLNENDVADAGVPNAEVESVIGIKTTEIAEDDLANMNLPFGIKVTAVAQGSVADKAGILAGDILVSINFNPVKSASALKAMLEKLPKGRALPVRIVRGNRSLFIALAIQP